MKDRAVSNPPDTRSRSSKLLLPVNPVLDLRLAKAAWRAPLEELCFFLYEAYPATAAAARDAHPDARRTLPGASNAASTAESTSS